MIRVNARNYVHCVDGRHPAVVLLGATDCRQSGESSDSGHAPIVRTARTLATVRITEQMHFDRATEELFAAIDAVIYGSTDDGGES